MSLVGEMWEDMYAKPEAENEELKEEAEFNYNSLQDVLRLLNEQKKEIENKNSKIVDLKAKIRQLAEWANVDVDEDGELVY